MENKIAVKNGQISNFEWLVAVTLDRVLSLLRTVVHHSSTNRPWNGCGHVTWPIL